MRRLSRLPSRADGVKGLLDLAETFGEAPVFELIMLCRTARGEGQDPGGEALTIFGNRLVEQEKTAHPDYTEQQARQATARKLGFLTSGTRTNFAKILAGGRRQDRARRGGR